MLHTTVAEPHTTASSGYDSSGWGASPVGPSGIGSDPGTLLQPPAVSRLDDIGPSAGCCATLDTPIYVRIANGQAFSRSGELREAERVAGSAAGGASILPDDRHAQALALPG